MSESDLDKLTQALREQQDAAGPDDLAIPTMTDVNAVAQANGVTLDKARTKSLESMLTSFEGSTGQKFLGMPTEDMAAPVEADVAAQAVAASLNAAANGSMITPGLLIDQDLTVTVHDKVDVTFESSYLKNTKLDTTYKHEGDVYIEAKDVRLTAGHIRVFAHEEKNTVTERKEIYRGFNVGFGSVTTLYTSDSNNTATGVSGDFSLLNMSAAATRVGLAVKMSHFGDVRHGMKLVELDSNRGKLDIGANIIMTAVSLFIVI